MGLKSIKRIFPVVEKEIDVEKSRVQSQRRHFHESYHCRSIFSLAHTHTRAHGLTNTHTHARTHALTHSRTHARTHARSLSLLLTLNLSRIFKSSQLFKTLTLYPSLLISFFLFLNFLRGLQGPNTPAPLSHSPARFRPPGLLQ